MNRTKDQQGNITETMTWSGTEFVAAGTLVTVYDRPVTVALRGGGRRTHLGGTDGALCGTNFATSRPAKSHGGINCAKCIRIMDKTPVS